MLEAAREARRQEIEAWRTEQEAKPFTFEWNGRIWNAGPDSLGRLSPVVMLAKSVTAQTHMAWSDADNQQVKLSMPELEELAAAMVQAQVDRNDEIYRKRLVRTVLIFTESSDQLSRATDRVPGLPASPGYVQ
ncbi:prophage tail protein [Shigella flexneri 2a]|nr:prophage tail protein [Shigella flexneri 2a]